MPTALPDTQLHTKPRPLSRALRRLLAVLIGLAVLGPISTVSPPSVAAGDSCTGWDSKYIPPDTIRVGRADGSVETVNFRTYVAVVMQKEWPGWLPEQARAAGAVAVKQYGWFYALAGKHRSTYVNAKGQCFDVRDGTNDQLYKPEKVTVGAKTWRIVDDTLGLSVRKSGKFFLTGYRAGTSTICASDATGTKLFAKSVADCANRGWSREQIQRAYYGSDLTLHWGPPTALASTLLGELDPPTVGLRTGRTLGQKHALITWDQSGERPTGATYQLQRLISGAWSNVSLAKPAVPQVALNLKRGVSHQFRVRLRDSAGNVGPWSTGPRFDARLIQDKNDRMVWSKGEWTRFWTTAASKRTVTYSTRAQSQSALAFTGRAVAVVGTMGPDRGRARIYVDNQLEGEIDLYSPTRRWRVLVFTREWAASASRVIRVEVDGTSGRPRVDVDGILFYR